MTAAMTTTLDELALPGGGFAMVAVDQRDSLRTMFDEAGRGRPRDDVLIDFKLRVASVLGPEASGVLIDRHYGFDELRRRGLLPAGTGLILAADALQQAEGQPVEDTDLDPVVASGDLDVTGVTALKLLVIWRRDERRAARVELVHRFVESARDLGLLSVLEPVVRATPSELADGTWDLQRALCEAAGELSVAAPSLYKAQVPMGGAGTPEAQEQASRALGEAISGPWVVLSQGVPRDRFLPAVAAACRAGASGFLAGRALWRDVVGSRRLDADLRAIALPRLRRLRSAVEQHARPWRSR